MLHKISLAASGVIGYVTGYSLIVLSIVTAYIVDHRLGVATGVGYVLNHLAKEINQSSAEALYNQQIEELTKRLAETHLEGKTDDTTIQ